MAEGDQRDVDVAVLVQGDAEHETTSGPENSSTKASKLPPEALAKIEALRSKIQLSMGQVILAIMDLPRYRHQSLADLKGIIVNPLLQDRLAIAYRSVIAEDGTRKIEQDHIVGIAIWASASSETDTKISNQIRAGAFPVRLNSGEWANGDNIWLLDVIASDSQAVVAVLKNFRQLVGDRQIKIHPQVARQVESQVLESLGAQRVPAVA